MKKNNFTKGFTLIELLVVIAIIGILAGIIYAPFQSARRKARDTKKVAEIKDLTTALALYNDSYGQYPATLLQLIDSTSDKLPEQNMNLDTRLNLNKYNYNAYEDPDGKLVGYHLYTHLETKSSALDGAAKCYGAAAPGSHGATTACVVGTGVTQESNAGSDDGAQVEAVNGVDAFFIDHTDDSDRVCASDQKHCILDYRGN